MLANDNVSLSGLVRLKEVRVGEQNLSGTVLPRLDDLRIELEPYPRLGRPPIGSIRCVAALQDLVRMSVEPRHRPRAGATAWSRPRSSSRGV